MREGAEAPGCCHHEEIVEIDAKGKNIPDLKKRCDDPVDAYKAVRSGFAYIRRDGHLTSILNSLRNKLHDPDLDEQLDNVTSWGLRMA